MNFQFAVGRLQQLVGLLRAEGVQTKEEFKAWTRKHAVEMGQLFGYRRTNEKMRPINELIGASFHPTLPLVMFNYTKTAHNTLYKYEGGWTDPIKMCRGIVFDLEDSRLIALPLEKFFNDGQLPVGMTLPNLPFQALDKKDGHLIIIFEYKGQFIATTRGEFTHSSGVIANEIIEEYVEKHGWSGKYPVNLTVMCELIHPETHVFTSYDWQGLSLIAARDRVDFSDYDYRDLGRLGQVLSLPVSECWQGNSIRELRDLLHDRSVSNREGFVVRFEDGTRVKFKYETYIAKMVEDHLKTPYTYIMNCYQRGSLEEMLSTLEEEVYAGVLTIMGKIFLCLSAPGNTKVKYRKLYTLVPPEEQTDYFKGVCRDFAYFVTGEERQTRKKKASA